ARLPGRLARSRRGDRRFALHALGALRASDGHQQSGGAGRGGLTARPRLGPGVRRVGDRVEVSRGEALEAERVEETRVLAHDRLRDLAPDADHLVAVIRVEDRVDVRPHVVEYREV